MFYLSNLMNRTAKYKLSNLCIGKYFVYTRDISLYYKHIKIPWVKVIIVP